jgi:hypothetical protein
MVDRSKDAHEPIARRHNERGFPIPISLSKREPVIEGQMSFRIDSAQRSVQEPVSSSEFVIACSLFIPSEVVSTSFFSLYCSPEKFRFSFPCGDTSNSNVHTFLTSPSFLPR